MFIEMRPKVGRNAVGVTGTCNGQGSETAVLPSSIGSDYLPLAAAAISHMVTPRNPGGMTCL